MAELVPAATLRPTSGASSVLTAGGVVLAIGGLYLGKEFFVPFTLGVLLAFALSPIVNSLRRWRVPRIGAVLITVALASVLIGGLSYVVTFQLISLAGDLPAYQQTMVEKIRSIRSSGTDGGVVDRLSKTLDELSRELSSSGEAAPPSQQTSEMPVSRPIPVTIEAATQSPFDVLRTVVGPLVGTLATIGIVIVFVIFVLLEREDIRDRFVKLVGAGDLQTSAEALKEAGSRVSRYLLMQLLVNITYGLPIGAALYLLGVPNAVLWGLLAIVLRFIPYLGPVLAAMFPAVLAFAVDPGWSMLLWVGGLFLVMELLSNNVVEPWLYGASTGLSSLAIISAAIFWTILWGPIGLILSTPLTVCLVVVGRYVPQLGFLQVLLGSDPVLTPDEQLYQRLLGGNSEAAIDLAETYVDANSRRRFYDEVALPTLRLAENDRQRNATDGTYKRTVAEGMSAVVREVADRGSSKPKSTLPRALGIPDLCIGGKTDLDCAAAEMVAQAVAERGIGARVLPPLAISQNGIGQLDLAGVEVVCLSYLAAEPQTFARFACTRLKKRAPQVKTIVCLWNPSLAVRQGQNLKEQFAADAVVFSVEAAAAQIDAWVAPHISDPMRPAPMPANERDRAAALQSLGLVTGESKHFDEVARKVAAAFGTPIALVTMVDNAHQHWPGAVGLAPKLDACRFDARETSVCGHVVALDEMLVVEDVAKDVRFANNPFLIESGIRFYAGAPLRTSSGYAVGSLCVIDTKPRTFGPKDREILSKIAGDLMIKVELNCQRNRALSSIGLPLDDIIPAPMQALAS